MTLYVTVIEQDGSTKREVVLRQSDAKKTILATFEKAGILTRANFNLVLQKNLSSSESEIAEYTKKLFDLGYLNQHTFKFIWGVNANKEGYHISWVSLQLYDLIESLMARNLLTDAVLLQILTHPALAILPNELGEGFISLEAIIKTLDESNLLNTSTLNNVIQYKNPVNVGQHHRNFVNNMVGFLHSAEAYLPGVAGIQPASPNYGVYKPENDLFWQLHTGLPLISLISGTFLRAGLLNQNTLQSILEHQAPARIKKVIEFNTQASPIDDFLLRSLCMEIEDLEKVIKVLEQLKLEGILNAQTMELAFTGYFGHFDGGWGNDKISAVKILIEQNLLTPLNLTFVDKGTFVYFDNNEKGADYGYVNRAQVLVDIRKYSWISRFNANTTGPKVNALPEQPVKQALNQLFSLTTHYFYKSNTKHEYTPLCVELLTLQEKLFTAYKAFEKDQNKPALIQAFHQHINGSRGVIEASCTFTEALAVLFNALLNAVQSLVTSSTERPWGRFFAPGQRALLMADLKSASADAAVAALIP